MSDVLEDETTTSTTFRVSAAAERPRMCAVVEPLGSDLSPLEPLLAYLRGGAPVATRLDFERGTLLPDGRLDLCKQGLGPQGMHAVREALRDNPHVRSLLVGADHLGPEGARSLAQLITDPGQQHRIEVLYLGCNAIGAEGAAHLANALEHPAHTPLQALWIKRNQLGIEGAKALAKALPQANALRLLDLVSNNLGPEGVGYILQALRSTPSLRALFLCGNELGVEGAKFVADFLRENNTLEVLLLAGNRFGDAGVALLAEALEDHQSLRMLGLSSNEIGPNGAAAIAGMLRKNQTLRVLELGFMRATEVLGVTPNALGDEGARRLAEALPYNTSLQVLDLTGNNIGMVGAQAFAAEIMHNEALCSLSLGLRMDPALAAQLSAGLCRNANRRALRARTSDGVLREESARIRSVYRTAKPGAPIPIEEKKKPTVQLSSEEIAVTTRVLQALSEEDPSLLAGFLSGGDGEIAQGISAENLVFRQAELLVRRVRVAARRQRTNTKAERIAREQRTIARTGIRTGRAARLPGTPLPAKLEEPIPLENERRCYVCRARYDVLDAFYDLLCPACASLNRKKREQTADLTGRTVLLTGCRVKIGYELALKLLRSGAEVIGTTRFPVDAARRFSQEKDFASFRSRLHLYRLDQRMPGAVEQFAAHLRGVHSSLFAIVHNAAQTIARPPAFYAEQYALEQAAWEQLPEGARLLLEGKKVLVTGKEERPLLQGLTEEDARLFPPGTNDGHGQPWDLRDNNSWRLRVGQVPLAELLGSMAVTALAPFVLLNELRGLLENDRSPMRFVVLVSAVEGQFYRAAKTANHPHTNMAKAAVNMLARTSAEELATAGIYLNAVDTGWITEENPWPVAQGKRGKGFEPPLDEVDGAARVLDPIFSAVRGEPPVYGLFLKDYRSAPW